MVSFQVPKRSEFPEYEQEDLIGNLYSDGYEKSYP